ncbi:MAG: acyl-CoA dehydrogenase [Halieaceae bacterium]|jgi:alkylation response protein AidB-like acyl-CoA dehydrogenase|nr:acyl-CoA dehydrogenase [Halieaceae bacterium]MBT5133878.1 acyl-CoA dehydrogenase [Halieaceae bacterium]MBT5557272.1 acyl-CoA dehydrogenase [Halieaceae bacterium]MBT6180392.1 acyl-CoA dehydrogenase [Halieaceae bacterium]
MIPRHIFDSDHEVFRDAVRKFFLEEAYEQHVQWEKDGQIDRSLWNKAGAQGMLCPGVSEAYGGVGADFRYNMVVSEEASRLGLTGVGFILHNDVTVPYLENVGSEAQKQKFLPKCVSGECIVAIAMTEPGTGSDLQGIRTTAVDKGDHYLLNGSKTFITCGQQADIVLVVCRTDTDPKAGAKAFSILIVEDGMAGFERGRNLEKMGMKAQDTSELFFNDVKVPKDNLLGEAGMGFIYLMRELPQERLSIAVSAVAACEAVIQETVKYVKQRTAFGKAIADFQHTQFKLAELEAEVTVMRVFIDRCAELLVKKELSTVEASKAKLLATELQGKVTDQCVQMHGGYGYMWEYPVARAYADARVQRIYGGTSEVMKLIIGRDLLAD